MGIEKFIRGVFTGKDLSTQEKNNATARLAIERVEMDEARNTFIMEYELQKLNGYEKLDDKDINKLRQFIETKTKISPEHEEVLKNEVKSKAEAMIQEKFKEAA